MQNYLKLLQDNIGENLGDIGFGDYFLDKTPKLDFIKIQHLCSAKDTPKRIKGSRRVGENLSKAHI